MTETAIGELRRQVAATLADGEGRELARLTDEEIAAAWPEPDAARLAVAPHLAEMTDEQREWATATALRSLVAREMVGVDNVAELDAALGDQGATEVPLKLTYSTPMELLFTLREAAERIIVAVRSGTDDSAYVYLYVQGEGVLLCEHVTGGGMHTFTLLTAADVPGLLVTLADPGGDAEGDGPVTTLTGEQLQPGGGGPLDTVMDRATGMCRITLLGDRPGRTLLTYTPGRGVWLIEVDEPGAATGITARTVSSHALQRAITRLAEEANP